MLAPNDVVLVKIPAVFRQPFDSYFVDWQSWARSLDGQLVTLRRAFSMGLAWQAEPGWDIDCLPDWIGPNTGIGARWLPTEWLCKVHKNAPNLGKIPCNCPLNQILNTGCKQPNHI